MVFKNIFDSARDSSDAGNTAGTNLSGYIPAQPNESISVPPHDPWQPITNTPQDPKIVRETSPQAEAMFNLVGRMTNAIGQTADTDEAVISDPSSTVDPGSSVMKTAQDITQKIPGEVSRPSVPTPPKRS